MKVTFPHMGNAYIPIKALLKGLKLDVVVPPLVSKRTLELGMKYSPEYACMPLKINMGNFIEAMENGANAIVMAGGWGPCRFGYYAQVERDILRDLGYDFKMIVLEAPDSKLSELLKQVKALGENVSMRQAYQAVKFAWYKLNAVEALERKLEYYLPRVIDKTTCETIYEQGLRDIDQVSARKEVDICLRESLKKLETLPQHHEPVLRLGLIGEIYTILEPGANYHVARSLGRLGVEVTRSIYLSEWVNIHLTGGWLKKNRHREIIKMSRPYLNYWVGAMAEKRLHMRWILPARDMTD